MRYPRLIWVTSLQGLMSHIPLVVMRETEEDWVGFAIEDRRAPFSYWPKRVWKEVMEENDEEGKKKDG